MNNHYEVIVVSVGGQERKETVQIQTTNTGGVERIKLGPSNPKDGIAGWIHILAHLSCYTSNDSRLIDVIKNEYLHQPSNLGFKDYYCFLSLKQSCFRFF